MKDVCVYTVLMGNYERLVDQPVAQASQVPFICFTDDPGLVSKTWQIRRVEPAFPGDSIRSQRGIKILCHKFLSDFRYSLYIDNTVLLKKLPEDIFSAFPLREGVHYMSTHSYRETVLDEFGEVRSLRLDDTSRIDEQLEHYKARYPETLRERPFWSALQIRDHQCPKVISTMEQWCAHVYRYARRDQLSFNTVCSIMGHTPTRVEIDNHESWFHRWPQEVGRNFRLRVYTSKRDELFEKVRLENEQLKNSLELRVQELNLLGAKLNEQKEVTQSLLVEIQEKDGSIAKLNETSADRRNEDLQNSLSEANRKHDRALAELEQKNEHILRLSQVVRSALKWRKRSWFKRSFHRWRPPVSGGDLGSI